MDTSTIYIPISKKTSYSIILYRSCDGVIEAKSLVKGKNFTLTIFPGEILFICRYTIKRSCSLETDRSEYSFNSILLLLDATSVWTLLEQRAAY